MFESDPPRLPEPANPYAPPEVDLRPDRESYVLSGDWSGLEPFSIDAALRRAWTIYKQRLGLCIGVVAAPTGIIWAFQIAAALLVPALQAAKVPAALVGTTQAVAMIGQVGLQLWLAIGQPLVILKLARGQDAEFGDLFRGGPYLLRFIATILLGLLALFLATLAFAIPVGLSAMLISSAYGWAAIAVIVVFVIAYLCIIFYFSIRLYYFLYILVDRNHGAIDSIRITLELTRGHVLELFGLILVASVISMAGVFGCVVGLIFSAPLGFLIVACGYVLLSGRGFPLDGSKPRADLEFIDDAI